MTRFLKTKDGNGTEVYSWFRMVVAALGILLMAYSGWLGLGVSSSASQQDLKDTKKEITQNHDSDVGRIYDRLDDIHKDVRMILKRQLDDNNGY